MVPNSGNVISILQAPQILGGFFIGVGTTNQLYMRAYPFESSVWTYLFSWPMKSVFQFANDPYAIFGVSLDNNFYGRPIYFDAVNPEWGFVGLADSGPIIFSTLVTIDPNSIK